MARTAAGATLTAQHRLAQLQIRALALQRFLVLWPLWEGTEPGFRRLVTATVPLVQVHHQLSSSLASGYFQAFRSAEGVGGTAVPRLADPPDVPDIESSLYVTGEGMARKALAAGQSPEQAMRTALVRTSGSVTRQSLEGGRDTLLRSTDADKRAQGWVRVTDAEPCAFCALLSGRGPAFSEEGAGFEAHDHCACSAEPSYEGSEWPGRAREFHDLYNEAVLEAGAADELERGTSNDLLNAFRRAYDGAR